MKTSCFRILLFLMATTMYFPLYAQMKIDAVADKNNQKVIKRYNRFHITPYNLRGASVGFTAVFGVKTNSLMSTEDVEVNVVKRWVPDAVINDQDNRLYFVEIKNKTSQTIYIDKGNSFRIYNDGSRYCYFDPQRDDSSSIKRIIAIPPHAKRNLSDYKAEVINKGKYPEVKIIDYPEEFKWNAKSANVSEGSLNPGEIRLFTEDNSPYNRSFLISYSKTEDFSTYSVLSINFYMRQLVGIYLPELYKEDNLLDRMGADQYTITNCEYGYGGVNRIRGEEKTISDGK